MVNLERLSKEKLLNAGYKFLRSKEDGGAEHNLPRITVSDSFGKWSNYGVYKTKKERDRVLRDLVENPKGKYIVID